MHKTRNEIPSLCKAMLRPFSLDFQEVVSTNGSA